MPEDEPGVRLTPKHYAYLKISEGCDHRCAFCIIPTLRGDLASRPVAEVLREAEVLAKSGVKELLVVSQDTSAYGLDIKYASSEWRGQVWNASFEDLSRGLGELGIWVRMHYVYPYPHVNSVIPLMAEGKILPYLDIPFQHASPKILKAMKRPGNQDKTLQRIEAWREVCPDITLRSTFVVGFPGETEADFNLLLDWLEAAQIDRVGAFAYENVEGAPAKGSARPRARGGQAGPAGSLHGGGLAHFQRQTASQGRLDPGRAGRRYPQRRYGGRAHQGRCAGNRRPYLPQGLYRFEGRRLCPGQSDAGRCLRPVGEPEGLIKLNRVPTARPAVRRHTLISRV